MNDDRTVVWHWRTHTFTERIYTLEEAKLFEASRRSTKPSVRYGASKFLISKGVDVNAICKSGNYEMRTSALDIAYVNTTPNMKKNVACNGCQTLHGRTEEPRLQQTHLEEPHQLGVRYGIAPTTCTDNGLAPTACSTRPRADRAHDTALCRVGPLDEDLQHSRPNE